MNITGLDLSLTSTGIAQSVTGEDGQVVTVQRCQPGKRTGHERMDFILGACFAVVHHADLVLLEAPVIYAKHANSAVDNIGLNWLVRHDLLNAFRIPYVLVQPSQLKIYATGYGAGAHAGKDQVLLQADRRYGHLVTIDGNDEADALVLCAMGCDRAGQPLVPVPKTHRRAIGSVTWPDLKIFGSGVPLDELVE